MEWTSSSKMPDFYDIHVNELVIPGVGRSYAFLHISDSHICVVDEFSDEIEAEYINARESFWHEGKADFARFFGQPMDEYRKNLSSADAFRKLLDFGMERGVDAILSTGDLLERMHGAGERFVRRQLEGLPMAFMATPGNHEAEGCAGIWQDDVQVLDFPGFRIVSVDDRKHTVADRVLERLSAILAEGVPAILMMHIPLLTDLNRDTQLAQREPYYYIDERNCDANCTRLYGALWTSPALKLILSGHVHGYMVSTPLPGVRQIIAPQGMAGGLDLLTVHG